MSSSATGPIGRTDAIHALVRNVVDTRYEDMSEMAVDATKIFILDSLGVATDRWLPVFPRRWASSATGEAKGSRPSWFPERNYRLLRPP